MLIRTGYILLILFSFGLSKVIRKKFLTPLSLFTFIWCFFAFLSTFGLLGLYLPIQTVHSYVYLSVFSFDIVYLLVWCFSAKNKPPQQKGNIISEKLVLGINGICFLFLIPVAYRSLQIALSYGYNYLRRHAGTALTGSTILQILYNWFLIPCFLASACLIISQITLAKSKPNRRLLMIVVANIILHSIIFAARALVVKIIFYMVFAILFCYNPGRDLQYNLKHSKKNRWLIFVFLVALLGFTVYLTAGRMQGGNYSSYSFLDSIILYYVGSFSLLSLYVSHPSISLLYDPSKLMFGKATFGCVANLYDAIIYVLFGVDYRGSDYLIEKTTEIFYIIGEKITFNAATTSIYPFMRDFGVAGIVIGFALLAFISAKLELREMINRTIRSRALYIFWLYIIVKSVLNYEPISPPVFFTALFIYLFTNRRESNRV